MARIFSRGVTKTLAQIAALVLVTGGLVVFVFTQTGTGTTQQAGGTSAEGTASLRLDLASAVEPMGQPEVELPRGIAVTQNGKTTEHITSAETVEEALDLADVTVGKKDQVTPQRQESISDGTEIVIKQVRVTEEIETNVIEYETEEQDDDTLEKGETEVETEGEDGEETVIFKVTTVDGKETDREEVDSEITTEPVTEIILVGTKEEDDDEDSEEEDSEDTSDAAAEDSDSDESDHSLSDSSSESSSDSTSSRDSDEDSNEDSDAEDSVSEEDEEEEEESPESADNSAPTSGPWYQLAQCESNGNWQANTGNGYYGGLQFNETSWAGAGGKQYADLPHQATPAEQIATAEKLKGNGGWGHWPHCSSQLGLN